MVSLVGWEEYWDDNNIDVIPGEVEDVEGAGR